MKKLSLLILLLLFTLSLLHSQELIINKVMLLNLVHDKNNDLLSSGMADGPVLKFEISLINGTEKQFLLAPSTAKFEYTYKLRGYVIKKNIQTDLQLDSFTECDTLIINPKEKIDLQFSSKVFLDTRFLNIKRTELDSYDYTKSLIEVLGTLNLTYTDTHVSISTHRIDEICFP